MIDWMKYDPKNPPDLDKHYLVSDGTHVDIAYFMDSGYEDDEYERLRWYPPDMSSLSHENVDYYAEINLPEAIGTTEIAQAKPEAV